MGEMFESLKQSLEEAIEYEKGERKLRVTHVCIPDAPECYSADQVRQLRDKLNCSQAVFAKIINVSVKTVRAWESGQRHPCQAALRILQIVEQGPEFCSQLLNFKTLV